MNKKSILLLIMVYSAALFSCTKLDDGPVMEPQSRQKRMDFDILVTRDGEVIEKGRTGVMTRSAVDAGDKLATMDTDIPFGLIGIDFEKGQLVLDNAKINGDGIGYSTAFDGFMWNGINKLSLSAYYPYVNEVDYGSGFENYAIPYSVKETEAGPLVSKTVERAINQLNMIQNIVIHLNI